MRNRPREGCQIVYKSLSPCGSTYGHSRTPLVGTACDSKQTFSQLCQAIGNLARAWQVQSKE
jgi:hypothetical protein